MVDAVRQRRLRALGIDPWTLRDLSGAAVPSATPDGATHVSAASGPDAAQGASMPITAQAPEGHAPEAPAASGSTAAVPSGPPDWSTLEETVRGCQQCGLCGTRTQTVFGTGARDAPLMIVGEGPGADEDASGLPFVGRAGKLLDEMLAAIDHSRARNVYIANVVKCRPPGNRDPAAEEASACRPYLDAQIALVKPRLIVALGRIAAQRLLATDAPLARLRGPLHHYGSMQTPLLVTYHPAYLLRSPREKAKSWQDLKSIWRYLHGTG